MSAAMLPPAPGLFSITTDWPQTSCRRLPTRRAVVSVEPPGVNGTTTRTGLAGHSAAAACDARMEGSAIAAAARPTKRRRLSIGALLREGMARLPRGLAVLRRVWRQSPAKSMRQSRHHPPPGLAFGEPDDRLRRVIRYSRGACDGVDRPRRTGYSAFAGYDGWCSLLRVLVLVLLAGNGVGAGQP